MTRRPPWLLLLLLAACAPATSRPVAAQDSTATDFLPPGFGSLRQDDLTLKLRTDQLEIRFLPLDERVLVLLGPDAYQSITALVGSQRARIDSVARGVGLSTPGLALVSFFALQPGAFFDAEVLNVNVRNRLVRPAGIVPYTPGFTEQRLEVRQLATAIYLFDEPIPVLEPFAIQYYQSASADWGGKLQTINRERQRVALRADQQRRSGPR